MTPTAALLIYLLVYFAKRLTACVTGGWGEKGCETGNYQSSEPTPKNAQSPSRPVHALLGAVFWKRI